MSLDHAGMIPENENEESYLLTENHYAVNDEKPGKQLYFYKIIFIVSLGGFLFGYDTGVISGAMIPLKRVFNLSNVYQEVIVSVAIAGAILGALISGIINDTLGRRPVMIIASCLFTIGSIILGVANGFLLLVLGRISVGIGIGLASMTVPVYMAEVSPQAVRGQTITIFQFFITLGMLIASLLNGAFSFIQKDGWRYMLGISGVPSFVMFIGCLSIPESPRWFIKKGRIENAHTALQSLRGNNNVDKELHDIVDAVADDSKLSLMDSLKKILKIQSTRRAVVLGCGLQFIQQISGINTVLYYGASIIQLAGITNEKTIIWLAAIVAFGNCFVTLVSVPFIEKVNRRKLTLCSVFGVFLGLCFLALTFFLLDYRTYPVTYKAPSVNTKGCLQYNNCQQCVLNAKCGFCYVLDDLNVYNGSCLEIGGHNTHSAFCDKKLYINRHDGILKWSDKFCPTSYGWVVVLTMIFYLAMFAPGLGPMPWTINAEIYPLWARSAGTSLSTATNWTSNLLVSLTFLSLMEYLTRPGAFLLYAVLSFFGLIFLYFLLPETKGLKLEEIEKLFKDE